MKILQAIFVDTEKTAVKIRKEDGAVEVINYDLNRQMLEENGHTEYEIEKNTHVFFERESQARLDYEKYLSGVSVLGDARSLLTRDFTEDELFEMKLAAFELDSVKTSKKRKIKIAIRKAKTIFELFSYIHELNQDLESK